MGCVTGKDYEDTYVGHRFSGKMGGWAICKFGANNELAGSSEWMLRPYKEIYPGCRSGSFRRYASRVQQQPPAVESNLNDRLARFRPDPSSLIYKELI